MAFCIIEPLHIQSLTALAFSRVRKNPAVLKNFRDFSQEIFQFLTNKGQSTERAITLVKYLPQAVSEFNANPEDRKLLREAGVSMDAIYDVEDQFKDYALLAKYLGIKNELTTVVVVNQNQLDQEAKITQHILDTNVTFDGDVRIINGKKYTTRVTSIAKVGFDDLQDPDGVIMSPALKHGNTVDTIAKAIFDNIEPKFNDFKDLIDPQGFQTLLSKLKDVKSAMETQGFVFRTGVTVFNKELGISGEIDLVAINPNGEAYILDFKTANQRFNETYLKNETLRFKSEETAHDIGILSKWKQYGTQGYIYAQMLQNQLGLVPVKKVGIIGINISYDATIPLEQSKIAKVVDVEMHNIPFSEVRPELKGKSVPEMYEVYKSLQGKSLGPVNEVKERKVFSSGRRKKNLDRKALANEAVASDAELKAEVDHMSSVFGNNTLYHFADMVNTGVLGTWAPDGITLYKNASRGTGYHEGWHHFSQLFLTQQQKDALYKSVQKDAIKFRTRDGRTINTDTAEFVDVEEFLADEFARFALNPKEYKYPTSNTEPRNFFQKIWDFLVRFFGANPRPIELFQKLYTGKIADYVPSINNAYWGNLNSLVENSQGQEIISNERFPLYVRSIDYLIGRELREATDSVGNPTPKSFTAFKQSKSLQRQVLDRVFIALEEKQNEATITDQQSDELYSILTNWRDYLRAHLTATEYDTLKDFNIEEEVFTKTNEELAAMEEIRAQYEDDIEDTEDIDSVSNPELYGTQPGNEESAFAIADDTIQDFFRTIPKIREVLKDAQGKTIEVIYELNELGFPENHKFYDVFYKTKKILSGAFDLTDMQARMQNLDNQRVFPELEIVNDYIGRFMEANNQEKNFLRAVQNVQFVHSFYHVMVMPEVTNMQLTLNYLPLTKKPGYYQSFTPIMVAYRPAARNLSLKIIKTWEKNFKDRRNKTFIDFKNWEDESSKFATSPLYLTEDGKLLLNPFVDYAKKYTSTPDGIRAFWDDMGVNFNPKVYQDRDSVTELMNKKNILTENIATYRNSILENFVSDVKLNLIDLGIEIKGTTAADLVKLMPNFVMDIYAKAYFIGNPVSFFNEKRNYEYEVESNGKKIPIQKSTDAMRYLYEELALIEEKFGERVSSGSFRIEDKTKYPYYVPNQLLITTELLNKVDRTAQIGDNIFLQNLDPIKNKWMKRSYFMRRMFDQNGQRMVGKDKNPVKIVIEDIASVRVITEDGIVERAPRSLSRDEKFFMDLLTLFKAGAIEIPRAETSSTMFTMKLSDYGKGKNLPILYGESLPRPGQGNLPETFQEIVKNYFYAEIEKRQWFMDNDPTVRGANKQPLSKQFNVFEGILSEELKSKIEKELDKTPEEIFAIPGIEAEFRKAVDEYFTQQMAELRPRFDALTKDQKAMLQDTLGAPGELKMISVTRAFVMNHFILSEEFYQLYFGDLNFYKNAFKRGKYVTNTGNAFYIDDKRNEMLNSIQNSTMASIFSGKKPGGKDFRFINTSLMEDVEMKSSYVSTEDSQNMLLQDILNARLDSGALTANTPEYKKFVEDTKKTLTKYNLINIADGQGIIGMDFYRNFSIITKIWDEKKEREYERQKAIFRNHYDLYFKLDEAGNKVRMVGDELTEAKRKDKELREQKPHAFFNPLKISYTGPQVVDGPTRPVFDKFSVRPVIPEMAIGKRDESLMLQMAKGDIDYVKFKSGSKVYQDSSFDWYEKINEGVYDLNDFRSEEIEPNQLFSAYLKHQLSTEGFKEENIFGSQFRKIVFGIKYSPMVRTNANLLKKFTKLEKDFTQTVEDLIEVEQNDLYALLGIQVKNGTYKIDDMKKFLKLLQTESIKRGVAINNIDYIQYDEATKNAKYPIDYAFNRQQIQDLISGLIDERLRRLKVNGSSLIQVSSAGTETVQNFVSATPEQIRQYGTTGLHYYHLVYDNDGKPIATSTMGVKVALIGEYENLLNLEAPKSLGMSKYFKKFEDQVLDIVQDASGNPVMRAGKIGFIEGDGGKLIPLPPEEQLARLNAALKDPAWRAKHKEQLTLVGYRIPTQNINFTDHMEIMEFLPKAAGSIIIPPIELIVKSGSDFDIDKMNIMRPSINKRGFLVEEPKRKVVVKGGEIETVPETLENITAQIATFTIEERELKKKRRELNNIMEGANAEKLELMKTQRAIRLTMVDLAFKAGVDERIIDKMIGNIEEGRTNILPEDNQLEDENMSEEELIDNKLELERVTADYQVVDQEIEQLAERYKLTKEDKDKLGSKEKEWFDKKRDYRDSRNNKLIDILSQTMSHPYYFELLVTPSSAAMFEGFTNDLMASQANMTPEEFAKAMVETDGKLYDRTLTPQQASTYNATSEAFDNLLSKRKDLGGYAIQRTFADIFNFVGFSIAKSYSVEISAKEFQTKVIHTPLISKEDRLKSLQNGQILMHGDSVNGIPISRSFDELISLTVDLAGAPAYPRMGINNFNKKHVQYLLHQKTDPKQVLWFMNQPVLKKLFKLYEDKRKTVSGYSLKHAIVELSLKMKVLKNEKKYDTGNIMKYEVMKRVKVPAEIDIDGTVLEPAMSTPSTKEANPYLSRPWYDIHTQNLSETDEFKFEDMDREIRNNTENSDLQKKVLAYFASITEEADMLMKLQFAENVDTTKYATLTSIIRNEQNRRVIHDSDLFNQEQINAIEKNSMIAPFDYTQKAKGILKALFPKLYTDRTIGSFSALVNDIWGAKNVQIERVSKIIENDYIEYVYKNYGTYKGQNISDYFAPKLINTDAAQDHEYFSYRLNAIKAEYPELLDIPFVSALYEDTYFPPDIMVENSYKGLDNKELHNLFFLRNPDNPTFEKNIFTNNWRNLINFDAERLGLKESYTNEDISKISDFFNELVYFSLYQSGLTNTGNGFSDLIPYEYWTTFISRAFDSYDVAKARNAGLEIEMLKEFEYRFRQMNPKVNWRTKTRQLDSVDPETLKYDEVDIEFYKNYYRGKDYKVTDDDLFMIRDVYLRTDEELELGFEEKVDKPKNLSPFEPGVYVQYKGTEYVLIGKGKTGIWLIYNPLEEGNKARYAAREVEMNTLLKRAQIVYHGTKNFLVTPEETIIDLDKNKTLKLATTDYNRIEILKKAAAQQKPPTPPPNAIGPEGSPKIDPCE